MNEIEKNALQNLIVIRKNDQPHTLKCPICFGEYQNFTTMLELDRLSLGEIEAPQFDAEFGRYLVSMLQTYGNVEIVQGHCDNHFSIKLV